MSWENITKKQFLEETEDLLTRNCERSSLRTNGENGSTGVILKVLLPVRNLKLCYEEIYVLVD
jgi:hypothetical protein